MAEIELKDITFAYGKGRPALMQASATLRPGINLLMGPNGTGKTTLLKVMAGMLQPQSGLCLIDRQDISLRRPEALRRVFYLADEAQFPLATIADMARLHAPFYPNFSEARLWENLRDFQMTGTEPLARMSLGSRRKANLAYALSLGVDALYLDEPANGLDILAKKTLNKMIARSMTDDNIVVIATHTVMEMEHLFDAVTFIDHGALPLSASVEDITSRLAFVQSDRPVPGAIYSETSVGGYRSIVRNSGGIESQVDYVLMFVAMAQGNASGIVNIINEEEDESDATDR